MQVIVKKLLIRNIIKTSEVNILSDKRVLEKVPI